MKIRNNMGPRTLPWGTPALLGRGDERVPLRTTWLRECRKSGFQEWSWLWIPYADSLENKAGCSARSQARDTSRDGPNLMSNIEGLHPLLKE